eukprot:gene13055-biopygen7986
MVKCGRSQSRVAVATMRFRWSNMRTVIGLSASPNVANTVRMEKISEALMHSKMPQTNGLSSKIAVNVLLSGVLCTWLVTISCGLASQGLPNCPAADTAKLIYPVPLQGFQRRPDFLSWRQTHVLPAWNGLPPAVPRRQCWRPLGRARHFGLPEDTRGGGPVDQEGPRQVDGSTRGGVDRRAAQRQMDGGNRTRAASSAHQGGEQRAPGRRAARTRAASSVHQGGEQRAPGRRA